MGDLGRQQRHLEPHLLSVELIVITVRTQHNACSQINKKLLISKVKFASVASKFDSANQQM